MQRTSVVIIAVLLVLAIFQVNLETQTFASSMSSLALTTSSPENVAVYFFDVGQGDSILVKTSTKNILIDGGPASAGSTLLGYLSTYHVTKIDLLVATHPHEDHIGGLISVMQSAIPIQDIVYNGYNYTTQTFNNWKTLALAHNLTQASRNQVYAMSPTVNFTVLSPISPTQFSDLNAESIVMKLQVGNTSVLLTGDAQTDSETSMLLSGLNLQSQVLKVGHHGSDTSTSQLFLTAIDPDYAVISAGLDNQYGHPTQQTLDILSSHNVITYGTYKDGTIILSLLSAQNGGTLVSGIISANTTWTKANSPFIVIANTLVAENITLTIEPGVDIKFVQGVELAVDGAVNANGTSTNPIVFTSNATTPKPNDWANIRFREKSIDASCLLNWTIIKYANIGVLAYASSPTIQNSIITNNAYFGIDASSVFMIGDIGNPIVKNCTVSDNGGSPDGGGKQGGILADVSGRITVQDCLIENNIGFGIRAYGGTTVTHCIIRNNTNTGAYGEMQISQSEISRNSQSGVIASGPVLYNIILDNSPYDISALGDVNATYNWWGTTNETLIAQHIFDYYDDYNQGKVTYAPFLNDSNTFFIISASAGSNGAIDPSGALFCNYGNTKTFRILANNNYQIIEVTVDGVSVGTVNSFTFNNIQSNHTISATFELTPTPSPSPTPSPTPSYYPTPFSSPTSSPTASPSPTSEPTINPTNNPTSTPTTQPSTNPTANPSPTIPEFKSLLILMILVGLISISIVISRKRKN